MADDVHNFTPELLAQLCAEKTFKRSQRPQSDPSDSADHSCFELIRRAFRLEDGYCLGLVLDLYKRIWSRLWIREPQLFEQHPMTVDDFTSVSFMKVYRLFKGQRFDSFRALNPFLAYLYRTLVRTIAEYNRSTMSRQARTVPLTDANEDDLIDRIPAADNPERDVEDKLLRQAIEERIALQLPDPKDRFLFDCWAKQNLSRAEIVEEYVTRWQDADPTFSVNDVRVALQRIHRHLLKDLILRRLLIEYRGGSSSSGVDGI